MKKHLLLSLALCSALFASAITVAPVQHLNGGRNDIKSVTIDAATVAQLKGNKAKHKAAASSLNYTLADEPYTALGLKNATAGSTASMAFEITPDVATLFAGNKITAINFYQGVRNNTTPQKNFITDAEVFLTYDLQGTPFATAKATMTSTPWDLITVTLDQPYEIEAGKSVYVGTTSTLKASKDLAIVVDYMMHDGDEGGWVAANGQWDNISDYYGYCCVSATIEGSNLPDNMAAVTSVSAIPYVKAGETFQATTLIRNQGASPLKSLDITVQAGDETPSSFTATAEELQLGDDFGYGKTLGLYLNVSYSKAGPNAVPVKVTVDKVNGVKNEDPNASAQTSVIVLDPATSYDRTVVIEEFTGTWCGWCPRGIVGMEYVNETYPKDQVITIAAHADDAMQADSYLPVINNFASGLPGAAVNRMLSCDPSKDELVKAIDQVTAIPTTGKVTGKASLNANSTSVVFETETMFSFDQNNAKYSLEYVLIQNNVGPYTQTNYYAGGQNGAMNGWENKTQNVSTVYNEVARMLDTYGGVKGSVPADITAGQGNTFTHEVKIPTVVKADALGDLKAIVLLVDNNNGSIVNAAQFDIEGTQGIDDMIIDNENAPVEYYNLQGVRVANPENGIFIRRQGTKVSKVAL